MKKYTGSTGANFMDMANDILYVVVRGSDAIDIKTSALIVITFGFPAVTVDEFFGDNLVENLAKFVCFIAGKI